MKLKDEGLRFTTASIPYIPVMKSNTSFAGKKVATSYKEYDIATDENGNVCLGKFNNYTELSPEPISTLIEEYRKMIEEMKKEGFLVEGTDFLKLSEEIPRFYQFKRLITTYNDKGLVTSYEVENILFSFKYHQNSQLSQWTATISGQVPCTRQFLYSENVQLNKIVDILASDSTQEWLYDEKGNMIAYKEKGTIVDRFEYTYNPKGKLREIKWYKDNKLQDGISFLYDEKDNKIQSNYPCRDIFNPEVEDDNWSISKLFINFYKDEIIYKQEIQYYRDGSKDVLFFNEQGRVIQKDIFDYKHYQGFERIGTIYYRYFEDKIERTRIDDNGEKEIVICKDIEYLEEPDSSGGQYFRRMGSYDIYDENIFFSFISERYRWEERKFVRTYFSNGEWETLFYKGGKPSYIVRKEYKVLED